MTTIGVFDSGLGGLSVVDHIGQLLATQKTNDLCLHYLADSAHAPYGEQSEQFVIERSLWLCQWLIERGAEIIVVACNTATAVAIQVLRQRHPHIPIIGLEPAIKPAVAHSSKRSIGVMATEHTLKSQKYQRLKNGFPHIRFVEDPCFGLVELIEQHSFEQTTAPWHNHGMDEKLRSIVLPMQAADIDALVLGCTHFPLIRSHIDMVLPQAPTIAVFDSGPAIARMVHKHMTTLNAANAPTSNAAPVLWQYSFYSSSAEAAPKMKAISLSWPWLTTTQRSWQTTWQTF